MTFTRRLYLFSIGIGLGCILVWAIYGKRLENTDWMPEHRVKLRLINTLTEATPQAQAMLTPLQLDLADLRASLDSCDVDFGKSRRTEDSLIYAVRGTVHGEAVSFTVGTLRDFRTDSTATLMAIHRDRR